MAQLKDLLVSGASRLLNGAAINGNVSIVGTLSQTGDILPTATGAYKLGDADHKWSYVYASRLIGTADQAVKDNAGNVIDTFYLPRSGGTMTGTTYYTNTSRYIDKDANAKLNTLEVVGATLLDGSTSANDLTVGDLLVTGGVAFTNPLATSSGGTGLSSFTANRLFYSSSESAIGQSHFANATKIGVNTTTEKPYNLYVTGTTYFDGNSTHKGNAYFADGTSYYINNTANGKLKSLTLDNNSAADTAYGLNIGSGHIGSNADNLLGIYAGSKIVLRPSGLTATTTGIELTSSTLYPTTNKGVALGDSSHRWSSLIVGTADSYGSSDTPIYWNAGVPKAITGVANAILPVRLQEYHSSAMALDTTACGWYYAASGGPFSSNADYMIMSQGYSTVWGSQIATDFRSNNLAVRNKNNGTWNSWKVMWGHGDAVTGAVWNDYAEYRQADSQEPGYVMFENGDDTLSKTTERLQHFAGIVSDTWGFSQGKTEKANTNIAVSGRVLAYPYQDRNNYKPGDCVCAAPGGKVDIMTRAEIIAYPDRIVGTVSCVPEYEQWGGGENADREPVKVNGRIWIKVR